MEHAVAIPMNSLANNVNPFISIDRCFNFQIPFLRFPRKILNSDLPINVEISMRLHINIALRQIDAVDQTSDQITMDHYQSRGIQGSGYSSCHTATGMKGSRICKEVLFGHVSYLKFSLFK